MEFFIAYYVTYFFVLYNRTRTLLRSCVGVIHETIQERVGVIHETPTPMTILGMMNL